MSQFKSNKLDAFEAFQYKNDQELDFNDVQDILDIAIDKIQSLVTLIEYYNCFNDKGREGTVVGLGLGLLRDQLKNFEELYTSFNEIEALSNEEVRS